MSFASCTFLQRKLFVFLAILSLLHLSIYTAAPTLGSPNGQPGDQVNPLISLGPSSEPRIFSCGETPVNGTAASNADESVQSMLTDGNLDTIVMGKAVFDVSTTNSSIINIPGPDLVVAEMHNPEPINASIPDFDTGENRWIVLTPSPSNDTRTNSCQYGLNQALVELDSFGIEEGSAVPSIRLDNLGVADTLEGADIAEIAVLEPGVNSAGQNTGSIPFFRFN